jgi:hypothetical protein
MSSSTTIAVRALSTMSPQLRPHAEVVCRKWMIMVEWPDCPSFQMLLEVHAAATVHLTARLIDSVASTMSIMTFM